MRTPKETIVTQETSASAIPSSSPESPVATVSVPDMPTADKIVKEPNEAFFGSLLLFCLALSLLAATGYFGFAGYRYFKYLQTEEAIPSLEALPKAETQESVPAEVESAEEKPAEAPTPTPEKTAPAIDKKTLSIKVLNGGAVKGVAGTYAEKLKTAGFTETAVGNAFGDYTGQTLYYAKGQSAGADAIKAEVAKTYPALMVKEAPTSDKDAAAATYVLILGR